MEALTVDKRQQTTKARHASMRASKSNSATLRDISFLARDV